MNKILMVAALSVLVVVITISTVPQIASQKDPQREDNDKTHAEMWVTFHFTDAARDFVPPTLIGSSILVQFPLDNSGLPIDINQKIIELLNKGFNLDNQHIQIPLEKEQSHGVFFIEETGVIRFTSSPPCDPIKDCTPLGG